ncbi:alpha-N-acetyl-neuraminyl-2,3-beta-galactosyl-1,3-N-acetyl-galactosaminide alpha-2,6-sialyltransferase isoform X2 [Cheilinus undulatus]|uniref:alpha-N-acetyl-neuraminyl-2,3-beta-galactosyl-1, 3-N-acetyl-galactosaminide alpha-2,6-sialyltransferase isoform X2 n=1 Tax=Cheilinus undulatus TaxID=241271 RepID=UPI001BD5353F|nr:alpha-N-acetyl-neuraminyl-2,3-beta-galactosyl-1,3-N-acetyl-galactosaminide alpha-2,6-sialyltransferase isoform X2 [Cheilinus undulatus]
MTPLMRRWLCLLSMSLPVLYWFGYVLSKDDGTPAERKSFVLRGYKRVSPGRMDQLLDMHCSGCALVSSSGHMLGAGAGAEIDQTGCVIRMNTAPTRGFEKDVGRRTSVRVVAHSSVLQLIKKEKLFFQDPTNTTYIFWGPERNMRQDGKGWIFNAILKMAKKYPNVTMYALTKEKVQRCDDVFQNETGKNRLKSGAYLSTGFFTMILAMEMCDSIYVYGMVNDNYCSQANQRSVPYHYYEKSRSNECKMYKFHEHFRHGGHRFITEKAIYARWATRHKIEFKYPSWSP